MALDQGKQLGSRSEREKNTKQKKASTSTPSQRKDKKVKYSVIISLAIIAFLVGSMIGYGILGKRNAFEVFDIDTWLHMYRLIFG